MRRLRFKPWVWAFAVLTALLICGSILLLLWTSNQNPNYGTSTPNILLIPPPTLTPVPTLNVNATQTPTPETAIVNGIGVGVYVQITGTGGEGLRLRSAPGTSSSPLFLGLDTEIFQVKDGPRMSDNIVWWYLVAPYDDTRAGWAAAQYLIVIEAEN